MSEARVISHAKHPQITELNISQLGLISATKRLSLKAWEATALQGGSPVR
ncbi:hypothetical protein [Deinococcus multiflagellatus]|uniref:Uncharacterized protein n=1 Tax=Deinococcus multiflagellatus TaxID=1656887 RepID=A0ABW1ZV58_9DEIO